MQREHLSNEKIPVLVIGAKGQLAQAIRSSHETWGSNFQLIFAGSNELDIREESHVRHFLEIHQPSIIINCAAYTNVDRAEDEPDEAMRLNSTAAGYLAKAACTIGATLVHISTDYVFDGLSGFP
ncbi:MAG: SDR family oxidoreductase, partial [Flavobacteriales bacterium]